MQFSYKFFKSWFLSPHSAAMENFILIWDKICKERFLFIFWFEISSAGEISCHILVISCLRDNFEMSQQVLKKVYCSKNARLIQFRIIDHHLSKLHSLPHIMQRSPHIETIHSECAKHDQFEQVWQAGRDKYKCDKPQKSAAKPHKSDNEAEFVNPDEWKPHGSKWMTTRLPCRLNHRCQLVHSCDRSKWNHE